jgi:Tail-tube assembly protein
MSFIDNIAKTTSTIGKVVKDTYGPLKALETVVKPNTFQYPLDVGNSQRYPHTVQFQTWIPKSVPITDMGVVQSAQNNLRGGVNNAIGGLNKLIGGVAKEAQKVAGKINNAVGGNIKVPQYNVPELGPGFADNSADAMRINRNQRYNDRLFDWTRRAERSDMITMFLPQGAWNDRINNAYNQQSMTNAIGDLGGLIEVGSAINKEDVTTSDMLNGPAGMEVASRVAGGLGMDSGVLRDAGLNALGYALNPQFEMLYNGTDLREFTFDFTMTPRSQQEALMIHKIVKKFKYHGSPAFVSGQGRYIVPPSYFDITFMFNGAESEWLPMITTCVLKSLDVDYTGGLEQWGAHADGSPIQVRLVMTFVELEMMHKKLRKLGY